MIYYVFFFFYFIGLFYIFGGRGKVARLILSVFFSQNPFLKVTGLRFRPIEPDLGLGKSNRTNVDSETNIPEKA